ncbi:hypothetical protein D3C86_1586370 [compost metagenome]
MIGDPVWKAIFFAIGNLKKTVIENEFGGPCDCRLRQVLVRLLFSAGSGSRCLCGMDICNLVLGILLVGLFWFALDCGCRL